MNSKQSTIYIVLGAHNELGYVERLLKCLDRQTYKNYQLVIVDDGSNDGTDIFVKKSYPKAILKRGDGRLWWTGSLFIAIEEVLKIAHDDDLVLTINNDCLIENNYLENLIMCSREYKGAIIGSLVVNVKDKKTILDAGVRINWEKYRFETAGPKKILKIKDFGKVEKDIDTLSTKGTLYPIKVFKDIGNFDKKHLPHYISDYEFACRAKRKGFRLLLSFKAIVFNEDARTGIGVTLNEKITIMELVDLLFSRRSRLNIIDHFWFVTLCCPVKYKFINYLRIFLKSLFLFSFVYPINNLRPGFLKLKEKYQSRRTL